MLTLDIKGREYYDSDKEEFFKVPDTRITLEHSLISISKWESEFERPFMKDDVKSQDELLYYIKCMAVDCVVNDDILLSFSQNDYDTLKQYMAKNMTATTISNSNNNKRNRDIITSEVLYYRMIALQIPFECQYWHINRLLMLINVCSLKNEPGKKLNKADLANQNRAINAARRNKLGTSG